LHSDLCPGRFDVILPLRILLLVLSVFSAATAILFYRLLGRIFHPVIGALTALYWVFNYDILVRVYQQGLETGLAVFCVTLLVYKLYEFETNWRKGIVTHKQLAVLGFVALLTVLSRLDLIFLAGLVGIWIIFRVSPLRYFLPVDATAILVSVLFSFLLRLSMREYYDFNDAALSMLAVGLIIKIPLAYFLGLYHPAIVHSSSKLAGRLLVFLLTGSALTTVTMLGLASVEHFLGFPRITLIYDLILTAIFFGLSRFGLLGLRTSLSVNQPAIPVQYFRDNWKQWLTDGLAYYGVIGAGLALYMLFNKFYFGTFSPVSGQIKRWWGSLPGRVYGGPAWDILTFFGIRSEGDSNTWYPLSTFFKLQVERFYAGNPTNNLPYFIVIGIFVALYYLILFTNKQKAKSAIAQLSMIPLFASAWWQVLYYHALGYSAYKEWYWITQLVTVILIASMLLGMLFRLVQKNKFAQQMAWVVIFLFALYLLPPFWGAIRTNMTYNEWKPTDPNNDIAAFLEANTEPGSIIGLTGGGNAGYFVHDRTVINMDGLINSHEYFQLLQSQAANKFLAEEGMNYILANPLILRQFPYKGQFAAYLELTDKAYGGKELMHYHTPD
jgi:hypothetical protein